MPRVPTVELVEKELDKHKHAVIRLQDELDALIKIFSHLRQCFENEMMSGFGAKKLGIPPGMVKQGQELTKMMTSVVDSKIRFDKAAKMMADLMTPEEELEACTKYIRSLPVDKRKSWIDGMRAWMRHRNEPYTVE